MRIQILVVGLFVVLIGIILELIRRERLTFKYAVGWLGISLVAVICGVLGRSLEAVSAGLGFVLLSNFVFFVAVFLAIFLGLIMTVFLCQHQRQNERIAQRIALLEEEVRQRVPSRPERGGDDETAIS